MIDQEGRPLSGAKIYVYGGSIIGNLLRRQAAATTDSAGRATIQRERDWHLVVVFIPDAEAPSVFGWCAEASGYEPLIRSLEDEGGQSLEAPLLPSALETTCPLELEQYKLERSAYIPRPAV